MSDNMGETRPEAAKKRDLRRVLSTALFIVLLGLLAWYVAEHWDEMSGLLELTPPRVAALLALAAAGCAMNCLYHLALLSTYGLRLSLTDWMGVVCVSNAIAYVLPMRADLLFTAAYYKRVKGLAYTKSASMAAGNIVFGIAFSILQIIAALVIMGLIDGQWPPVLWLLAVLGTAGVGAIVGFSFVMEKRGKTPKRRVLADIVRGFNELLHNRTLLMRLLLCQTGSAVVRMLMYMVCFEALGQPVRFYEALFYNSVSWLAGIVAIVPGNVGVREAVMGAATSLMGSVFNVGVAASLLERAAVMIAYIIMALCFAIPVYRRFSRAEGLNGRA